MQNFGKIKTIFNGILAEGVVSKSDTNKQLFQKYIKTIKENEILKTQFLVYHNIENKFEPDSFKASQYVQENIDLLKKFDKKAIEEANKKLADTLTEEQASIDGTDNALYESISTLILTEKKPETVDTIVEAMASVVDYVKANKKEVVSESESEFNNTSNGLPKSMLAQILVDRYNERYSELNETEKQVLKSLIESNDEQKKEAYGAVLQECLGLVNERLKDCDLDTKDRLLRVKEKLLNDKQVVDENYVTNISKLVELKNNLSEK